MIRRVIRPRGIIKTKRTAYESFGLIFNSLSRIGSSLIAVGVFAYIIGWLQAESYYDVMGATWVLKEFSPYDFLFYSWISIIPVLGLLYNGLQEITEKGEKLLREINFIGNYVKIGLKGKSVNLNKPLGNVNRKNKSNNFRQYL